MRLRRGGERFTTNIWPGYVDAVTTLLMVIMFALTIAMVVQAVLRERIESQDTELGQLGNKIAALSSALSSSETQSSRLNSDLLSERERLAQTQAALLAAEKNVTNARSEIDAQAEAARLAAARREALEAMVADLRKTNAATAEDLGRKTTALSEAEAARLVDAAAAAELQKKLEGSEADLTAMTLQLEDQRKKAEETLTLLAAAEAAKSTLSGQVERQASEAEKNAALLAVARQELSGSQASATEEQKRVVVLGQQVAQLSAQLANLQAVLNVAGSNEQAAQLKVEDLGQQLNTALLRAAEEEKARSELERQAREKAEAEATDLSRYRSEFFGRLSQILEGRKGVRVVGDRFVFSSEVLFPAGEATLSPEGRDQIRGVTDSLKQISAEIPPEIDWMIRVDGHTDTQPLSGQGRYRDNWELSQARALAVVRYMIDDLGFPADRLAAAGFGDTRPIAANDTPEGRAQNRRIELKLTER